MAKKLTGHIFFIGRMDPIQVYMSCGKCIVRAVSSLTGERVKNDPVFRQTMQQAALLGRASRIASFVYSELPRDFRQFWMYRAFTGEAIQLLRQGKADKEAKAILWKTYAAVWVIKKAQAREKECRVASVQQPETSNTIQKNKTPGVSYITSIVSLYGQKRIEKSRSNKNLLKRYLLAEKQSVGKKNLFVPDSLPP
jgi:hypothetical protein